MYKCCTTEHAAKQQRIFEDCLMELGELATDSFQCGCNMVYLRLIGRFDLEHIILQPILHRILDAVFHDSAFDDLAVASPCGATVTKEIAEKSIYTYLEQELNMQSVTSKRRITVEKATSQDRELIFMDSYNCLAVVTSNTFNSDGVMFEYTQSRHQPEYFSFHDTATRKKAAN